MPEPALPDIQSIDTEAQLEDLLSRPSAADVELMRHLPGDLLILGAGGKMGPSLALRARRAVNLAGSSRRVIAVSRFSSTAARQILEESGVETIACDLLEPEQVNALPICPNVIMMAGRKFGTGERSDLTWASNTVVPSNVASRFRESRVVAFSTGNVYPLITAASTGSVESDRVAPVGEYAQSCLGRERVIEYFSHKNNTPCVLFRLNYAVDLRYGVLVDIAWKVMKEEVVSLEVPCFNVIWQGDANSLALRSLTLCQTPPRALNVTGPEKISVRQVAEFFAHRWGKPLRLQGEDGRVALLSDASLCFSLLGKPEVPFPRLLDWVAHWVESGGSYLGKPTKYEVADGSF